MTGTVDAYLALGSNVGDRLGNLRQALQILRQTAGVEVVSVARLYETEPVGVREQPWFLNSVVMVRTTLTPHELLSVAKGIESTVGRTPTFRWGPREIDVDVILYGDAFVSDPDLVIPHPRMSERLFVLLPLRDLIPGWRDRDGVLIGDLVDRLHGSDAIRLYPETL